MNQDDLLYLASALAAVALWVCGVGALYAVIEGAYFIFCKATGREY